MAIFRPRVLRVRVLGAAAEGVDLAARECLGGLDSAVYGEYAVVFALRVLADAPELGHHVRSMRALLLEIETEGSWR
jgi:hypothetical protein